MNFEWTTKEHHNHDGNRGVEWYVAVSVIAVAVIVTSLILNNVLLAIIIAVGFIALILSHRRGLQDVEVSIDTKGVRVNDMFYTYNNLESFFVNPEQHHLILKTKRLLASHIVLPVDPEYDQEDLDGLTDFLDEYIPEEEMHENVFEQFMEYLGF